MRATGERRQRSGNRAFAADERLIRGGNSSRGNHAIPDPAPDCRRVQIWPASYRTAMLDDMRRADDEIAGIEMMTVDWEVVAFGWAGGANRGIVGQVGYP
jgi:hypothetical protein